MSAFGFKSSLASSLLLLGMSGMAWGQCVSSGNSLESIGATSVLDLSGQGNFACSDMSPGPDGGTMQQLPLNQLTFNPSSGGDQTSVNVTVNPSFLEANEIDAIYVRAKGNGARCLYTFSDYTPAAIGIESGGDGFAAPDDVVVCADGVGVVPPEPEPEPIVPISTAEDVCEGVIAVRGVEVDGLAVVTARSLDGQTVAVCNTEDTGATQVQCVNICENFTARADTQACATASGNLTNGQQDLEACRPCDLSDPNNPPGTDEDGNGLLYCWEYTNSVVRLDANPDPFPTIPGTNVPRDLGTILPHKPAQATEERIEVFNGCYLATTFLNGRPYSFTTCN